jgi:hypothetical protein
MLNISLKILDFSALCGVCVVCSVLLFAGLLCAVCCVLCAVCCVLCAVCCVLCAVCCVLCAVCCVLCAVCCVLCAVCCVLCAVCCVLCVVCCVLCAVCCVCSGRSDDVMLSQIISLMTYDPDEECHIILISYHIVSSYPTVLS